MQAKERKHCLGNYIYILLNIAFRKSSFRSSIRTSRTALLTQLSISDLLSAELCHSRRSSRPTMLAKRRDPLRWEEHHIFIIPHPVKTSAPVSVELWRFNSLLSVWAVKDEKLPDVIVFRWCAHILSRQPLWRLWWCSNWISMCHISHQLALNIFSFHGDDLSDFLATFFLWLCRRIWCWSWCSAIAALTAAITCTTWTRGRTSSTTLRRLALCSTWRPVSGQGAVSNAAPVVTVRTANVVTPACCVDVSLHSLPKFLCRTQRRHSVPDNQSTSEIPQRGGNWPSRYVCETLTSCVNHLVSSLCCCCAAQTTSGNYQSSLKFLF